MLGVAARIDAPPHGFYLERDLPLDVALRDVLNELRHAMGPERDAVNLAEPFHAVVGREFQEHPIRPAVAGRRVFHHVGI